LYVREAFEDLRMERPSGDATLRGGRR